MRIKYVVDDVRVNFWFFSHWCTYIKWKHVKSTKVLQHNTHKTALTFSAPFFLLSVYLFLFLALDAVQYTYYTNVQWIVHIEFQSAIGFWNSINATVVKRTSFEVKLVLSKTISKIEPVLVNDIMTKSTVTSDECTFCFSTLNLQIFT